MRKLEKKPYVKVGFLKGDIVVVAATHEFGTDRAGKGNSTKIPERSYLRSTFDEKENSWRVYTDKLHDSILIGKETVEKALVKLGLEIQKSYMDKINSNIPPALAESTIKTRTKAADDKAGTGTQKTLVDTGLMLSSVKFQLIKDAKADKIRDD